MSDSLNTPTEWGRRAQALPGWTWTRGWCLLPDNRGRSWVRNWCRDDPGFGFSQVNGDRSRSPRDSGQAVIDPDHPGNAGFLLDMLDEAHGVGEITHSGNGWQVCAAGVNFESDVYHPTLGRAVIATSEHLGGFVVERAASTRQRHTPPPTPEMWAVGAAYAGRGPEPREHLAATSKPPES